MITQMILAFHMGFGLAVLAAGQTSSSLRMDWDRASLQLIQKDGVYGRIIRLRDNSLLCGFELRGQCWTRRSTDNGKTWVQEVMAASFEAGNAANPELLELKSGKVILYFNERPRDGMHPFTIRCSTSDDGGRTWKLQPVIFTAGTSPSEGCWEPAAIQLPGGEIQLYFADESPYSNSEEQQISMMRSQDGGVHYSSARAISFRKGGRDGMPVPLILQGKAGIALAIEDNGTVLHQLQPAIIKTSLQDNWKQECADETSSRRRWAITPQLSGIVYAGAPYLRQLSSGETLLACQMSERGRTKPQMVVYIGDNNAGNFTSPSAPFALPPDTGGLWNSLFIKSGEVVTALSATTLNGVHGLWAIDGRLVSRGR